MAAENIATFFDKLRIKAACLGLDELGVGEARDVARQHLGSRDEPVARRPRLAHSVREG